MEVAVIVTRLDGEIIYWNRFAEELYGWPEEEVIGRNIVEIVVPEEKHGARGGNYVGTHKRKKLDGGIQSQTQGWCYFYGVSHGLHNF